MQDVHGLFHGSEQSDYNIGLADATVSRVCERSKSKGASVSSEVYLGFKGSARRAVFERVTGTRSRNRVD